MIEAMAKDSRSDESVCLNFVVATVAELNYLLVLEHLNGLINYFYINNTHCVPEYVLLEQKRTILMGLEELFLMEMCHLKVE